MSTPYTPDLAQRALVLTAIDRFITMANAKTAEHFAAQDYATVPVYTAEPSGRRYRIVMQDPDGSHRSVHAFVDGDTGDLLKAAGWKVPAKGARYNLLDEFDVVERSFTWSGGYLYVGGRK